jgi:hypothetical protein
MYYTATEYRSWEPTGAKTLKAAKAVAANRNPFVGQPLVKVGLLVATDDAEKPQIIETVSVKRNGVWIDQQF